MARHPSAYNIISPAKLTTVFSDPREWMLAQLNAREFEVQ